jgi:hypothetical protein
MSMDPGRYLYHDQCKPDSTQRGLPEDETKFWQAHTPVSQLCCRTLKLWTCWTSGTPRTGRSTLHCVLRSAGDLGALELWQQAVYFGAGPAQVP